ncbi:MAG: 4Fe-4S binding protein, partial [Helicobacteraceae bacterium]|nr:4Fe-4S binding protein [Helicobacteraceae bacterium]
MKKYRFLILRRLVQIGTLFLFALGNYAGVKVLEGNLSAARLLGSLNIADPFGFLQAVLAGSAIAAEFAIGALIVLAFYAIVGGRVFCSFVCP